MDIAFQALDPGPEAFDAFLDRVMDELSKIGIEGDLTASLATYEASFAIPAPDLSADALITAVTSLRTALHAADCGTRLGTAWTSPQTRLGRAGQADGPRTPGWPSTHEWVGTRGVAADLIAS